MSVHGCPSSFSLTLCLKNRASSEIAHDLSLSYQGTKWQRGWEVPVSLSPSPRCYSFGIGPNVCRRLVNGLATVSKGSAEFLEEGERLQPKVGRRTSVSSGAGNSEAQTGHTATQG